MRKFVVSIVVLSFFTFLNAKTCFEASGKAFKDAQTIRKIADKEGWKVGKVKSIAAGTFIKSKKVIYPEDILEVCIKEKENKLVFKAQSEADDAGDAKWRQLFGKKYN